MKMLAAEHSIADLSVVLNVSPSGYYNWLKRPDSPRKRANTELLVQVAAVHQESRQTYGSPRVTRELQARQIRCSENRVARIMKKAGIKARQKTPFRPRTTDSRHDDPIAPNRLKEIEKPTQPNRVWVADITYIWTLEGWLYLAAVMDLCSRKILGWAAENHMETDLVREALKQALVDRRPAPGLLHHSDRGSQYASSAYNALLHSWQIVPSMSAAGNCYDNAAMEAFWSTLKTEAIHGKLFRTREEAKLAIFDYIETFYNRKRLHSALDFKSPVDFENQLTYNRN